MKTKRRPGRPQNEAEPLDYAITLSCTESDLKRIDAYRNTRQLPASRSAVALLALRSFLDTQNLEEQS